MDFFYGHQTGPIPSPPSSQPWHKQKWETPLGYKKWSSRNPKSLWESLSSNGIPFEVTTVGKCFCSALFTFLVTISMWFCSLHFNFLLCGLRSWKFCVSFGQWTLRIWGCSSDQKPWQKCAHAANVYGFVIDTPAEIKILYFILVEAPNSC